MAQVKPFNLEEEFNPIKVPALGNTEATKQFLQTLLENFKKARNAIASNLPGQVIVKSAYIKIDDVETTFDNKRGAIYINDEMIFVCFKNTENDQWEQQIYQGLIEGILDYFLISELGRRFGKGK
jgi:hypothetical protein